MNLVVWSGLVGLAWFGWLCWIWLGLIVLVWLVVLGLWARLCVETVAEWWWWEIAMTLSTLSLDAFCHCIHSNGGLKWSKLGTRNIYATFSERLFQHSAVLILTFLFQAQVSRLLLPLSNAICFLTHWVGEIEMKRYWIGFHWSYGGKIRGNLTIISDYKRQRVKNFGAKS